jgi:DNA-binding XRE family transcriptional regulator/Uma2 family endonuclease
MKNRLRFLRVERNWSQAELAKQLGVSRQTVNALEVGKYDPSLPLALKIARLFSCPIETIFLSEETTMFAHSSALNPHPPSTPIFHRFTPNAIKVIKLAQEEAHRLKHNFVGTEQILLGLIREEKGIAASVLKSMGVSLKPTRLEIEKIIGRGNGIKTVGIPFTPRAKRQLDCAVESADELGHFYVDTENLLLGMLKLNDLDQRQQQGEGVAIIALRKLGVDLEALRQRILEVAPRGIELAIASKINAAYNAGTPTQQRTGMEYLGDPPTTDFISGEISARFCALLFAWVEPCRLGRVIGDRTEYNLPDGEVIAPRISFILGERLKRVPRTYPELLPDLVVEIKSAFDQLAPLETKIAGFINQGVNVGLLINPDQHTITVYRAGSETVLHDGESLTLPDLLPGWQLPLIDLWSPVFE